MADRKGDVLVAQNKIAEARAAYIAALAAMGPKHPGSQLVRIKLEAIGGTAPAAPKARSLSQSAGLRARACRFRPRGLMYFQCYVLYRLRTR